MAYMRIRDMIALHHSQYLKEDSYPADKVAAIVKTTDEWGILGNFFKNPAKGGIPPSENIASIIANDRRGLVL